MIRTAIEFHAREYSSAAEILAAAARRRNSPYRAGPAEKVDKRAPVLAHAAVDARPMWQRMEIHFDAHVVDRQRHLARQSSRWKTFIRVQAEASGLTYSDVIGRSRKRDIVQIRQRIWLEMHRAGKSFLEIAQIFSGRDHTTVLSGVRAAERREQNAGRVA